MTQTNGNVVTIPVWFVKLAGWAIGLFSSFFLAWMVWLSINVIEIRTHTQTSLNNQAEIRELREKVHGIELMLAKHKQHP